MLTELDVVNECLASMGEAPVSSLNANHPYTVAALNKLKRENQKAQSVEWWFNDAYVDAVAVDIGFDPENPDMRIPLGSLTFPNCKVTKVYGPLGQPMSWRGGYLWDHQTSDYVRQDTRVRVVFELRFIDTPPAANEYIAASAILAFQSSFDADSPKAARLKEDRREAYVLLNSEHIRVKKTNLLDRPTTMQSRIRSMGNRPPTR